MTNIQNCRSEFQNPHAIPYPIDFLVIARVSDQKKVTFRSFLLGIRRHGLGVGQRAEFTETPFQQRFGRISAR